MTILMAATLAGGLLATDAQARGGGGGHGGGFGGGHVGGFGGHSVGTRMSSGFGRGFHGDHRHGGYELGYGDLGWDCSPYGRRYGLERPNVCY
jgi:hypothetical protein